MEQLTENFVQLRKDCLNEGWSEKQVLRIFSEKLRKPPSVWKKVKQYIHSHLKLVSLMVLVPCVLAVGLAVWGVDDIIADIEESPCLMEPNIVLTELGRPLMDCEMCRDLKEIAIVDDISQEEFAEKYATSDVPVVVKQATKNWTAMDQFSFQFFKDLYANTEGSFDFNDESCQFFSYESGFDSLGHVFNMSDARSSFQPGEEPWYIGWSNCDGRITTQLRKHYQRPHFLPADAESSFLDWLFMGGPGRGAVTHLDNVHRPSWQAQIKGRKTWSLIPSPECEHVCVSHNVTVEKGDIIVLNTNEWYHATFIHPGEISITIGSEYD